MHVSNTLDGSKICPRCSFVWIDDMVVNAIESTLGKKIIADEKGGEARVYIT